MQPCIAQKGVFFFTYKRMLKPGGYYLNDMDLTSREHLKSQKERSARAELYAPPQHISMLISPVGSLVHL